jgi:GDP-D-mannose dehydratase
MAENPSMMRDLTKSALTTAIGVVVTYFVTSAIKKDAYKQTDIEKEKQRMEALEKTNKLLADYVTRYDSLHTKYVNLVNQQNNLTGIEPKPVLNAVTQSLITGNWISPDGTVQWTFENNRTVVNGVGSYASLINADGNYTASGGSIQGTVTVHTLLYLPVNETMRYSFSLSSDNQILIGTTTEANGNVTSVTLYKN